MNKDQVKGTAKDIAGKIQEEAGKAVGSKEQEAKGLDKQVSGKAQKKYGDAKEAVKDAVDKVLNPGSNISSQPALAGFVCPDVRVKGSYARTLGIFPRR